MLAAMNSLLDFYGWPDLKVKALKIRKSMFCDESVELNRNEYIRLIRAAETEGNERLSFVLQTICATGIRVSELRFITAGTCSPYESSLKSCVPRVPIYLIGCSNKELTCFPTISTMAEQLHISVSAVKWVLCEPEMEDYIKKAPHYRSDQGQTSNLLALVLRELPPMDGFSDGEVPGESKRTISGETGREMAHITFETLKLEKGQKEKKTGMEARQYQENRENQGNRECDIDRGNRAGDTNGEKEYKRAGKDNRVTGYRWIADFFPKQMERKSMCGCRPQRWSCRRDVHSSQRCAVKLTLGWMGRGQLVPPMNGSV